MIFTNAEFRTLVETHTARAQSVAYGLVRDQEDAREIAQEAFLRVHLHAAEFEGTAQFSTWLYRIVVNLSIDTLRKRPKGRRVDAEEALELESKDCTPFEAVHGQEVSSAMQAALDKLSSQHREAIVLREVECKSYSEMATITGVPIGTVMSRLFHARRGIQSAMQEAL